MSLLPGCAGTSTKNLTPVSGFDAGRYAGSWYEIARFPHVFERGLTDVTAEYTAQADGSIRVVNRGYDPAKGKWRSATARAVFAGARDTGLLCVTFFWPF
jgi:apolipoprotein D and lipocalin family protein